MDTPKAPDSRPALSMSPARFQIVLAENGKNPLAFVSPPIDDIVEMAAIEKDCFSLSEASHATPFFADAVQQRFEELVQKAVVFRDSPTFFNRLANLQRAMGDLEAQSQSLRRAIDLDQKTIYLRKAAENLLERGETLAAQEAFRELGVSDSQSALRLASVLVLQSRLGEAEDWVSKALDLDPNAYPALLFQGGIFLVSGRAKDAVRVLRQALAERPTSSVASANLGMAYLAINNPRKALISLQRSAALDPLNASAIIALSDVAHLLGKDAEAINSIRYFLQFEQKQPAIWSRLARSLLKLGSVDECIAALKRQGALERSPALWNNLGVAYAIKGLKPKSIEAFKHALSFESPGSPYVERVAARNIAQLISTMDDAGLLLGVTQSIVDGDPDRTLAKDPRLCDIYGFHISALWQNHRQDEATRLAETLLGDPALGEPLARWIFQSLIGIYGLSRESDETLVSLLDKVVSGPHLSRTNVSLMNNVAFAMIELNRFDEAERCIALVSHALHRNSYLTATFGLLHMRRGRLDRGEELYREAIGLAHSLNDKTRIRQKMLLEIGRYYSTRNSAKAKRALEKALKETKGERVLLRDARRLLESTLLKTNDSKK